jgi:hypothetical protein
VYSAQPDAETAAQLAGAQELDEVQQHPGVEASSRARSSSERMRRLLDVGAGTVSLARAGEPLPGNFRFAVSVSTGGQPHG